jgi:bacteriocin-like protein
MEKRVKIEAPRAGESQTTWNQMTVLTDAELQAVSGGLNPQPLPPRREPNYM